MFKLNVTILIVIAALGASALGFFIVKDLRGTAKPEETELVKQEEAKNELKDEIKASLEDPALDEAEKPDLPQAPSLDREIIFKALIREEDKPKIEAEIKIISQTLKENTDYHQGWLQLGILRKYIGDYEGAGEVWEYAAKIRQEDYVAYNNLGDLYHFYLKNFTKSESMIKKVIELKPDYVQAYKNLFELYTLSYKEKEPLADDALILGISKNLKAYDLMITLAMYYKENGDKVGARKYFEEALKLNPPNKSAIEAELASL